MSIIFYHPTATMCWVCIGIPLGMNLYVIEQFVHFKHKFWLIGGEWYHQKILGFIVELCSLIDAHIIHVNKDSQRQGSILDCTKPGHLYAIVRKFEEEKLVSIMKIIKSPNETVRN